MIIGIDETGHVALGQRFVVAVALIRPSALPSVTSRLERWEDLTRRALPGRPAEIKSTALSEEARRDFVNKVLVSPAHDIWYFAVLCDVDEETLRWGEIQRDHYVTSMAGWEAQAAAAGHSKFARQLSNFGGWLRNTPPGMTVKATTLNHVVTRGLNDGVGLSAAGRFDEELGALRFEIDQGFTRGSVERWQWLLRNFLMIATQSSPITMLNSWTESHPFVRTFIDEQRGDYIRLKPAFAERFNFVDSKVSVAVRVADQVAGLLRRRYVDLRAAPYLDRMTEREVPPPLEVLEFAGEADVASEAEIKNLFAQFSELAPPPP
jgi:hypothetical protein